MEFGDSIHLFTQCRLWCGNKPDVCSRVTLSLFLFSTKVDSGLMPYVVKHVKRTGTHPANPSITISYQTILIHGDCSLSSSINLSNNKYINKCHIPSISHHTITPLMRRNWCESLSTKMKIKFCVKLIIKEIKKQFEQAITNEGRR